MGKEKIVMATGGERESLNCPVTLSVPTSEISGDAVHLVEEERCLLMQ